MKTLLFVGCAAVATLVGVGSLFGRQAAPANDYKVFEPVQSDRIASNFDLTILVNGQPLNEFYGRGRSYVEAIAGAEYEVRVRNPMPFRVAVSLSVDGLNTIDARHTTAWNASKWVIEPYGTITINGWQMSSERARRFYFTSEEDSYGAKLGQTSNLGVISAVFFREVRPITVIPIMPPPSRRVHEDSDGIERNEAPNTAGDSRVQSGSSAKAAPVPRDDDYAATGIGRSVRNDVQWVNMDLDSRPVGAVTLRYEYYNALVRLGILPRGYRGPDPLRRREGATGFEDRRFSPDVP
ncbi:MAG TPA: hypothetical protein VJT50_11250 [Pyrinomonadaceae bacterium]|nr:hypothetical protein [Pyrinomonadaceae bacterium]